MVVVVAAVAVVEVGALDIHDCLYVCIGDGGDGVVAEVVAVVVIVVGLMVMMVVVAAEELDIQDLE